MLARAKNWRRVPIKSVYNGLYDGPHATPKPCGDGPVFLGIKNVTDDGQLKLSDIRHISEAEFPKWTKRVLPQEGDIIFTYEATLNRYAVIPKGFRGCLGRRMALIRPDTEVVDTQFLFQYFFSADWRQTISQNTLSGATVDRIPLTKFPDFEINLPPLNIQHKIASILSAYDDLIENNTRRIKILEEMAQTIYREWFVNFRFPGHEKVKMVVSPLGKIPEGWEVKALGDVCTLIKRGISPKYDETSPSMVINQKCIRNFRINLMPSRRHIKKVPVDKYVQKGDVLINSTGVGTLGRVAQVLRPIKDCTVDSHVTIVRCQSNIDNHFFGLQLFELQGHFERLAQGATGQTELSRQAVSDTLFLVAPRPLQEKFSTQVEAMRLLSIQMVEKNENLRQARDLLLPKLISGTIDVSDLEIKTKETAA